jgi:4-hydroxybenzoate polyprenyltransferase
MATAVRGAQSLKVYLEMIKFEHSIFALPFAMLGMMWGSRTAFGVAWPGTRIFLLIVLAMVSVRSAAMAYNRIADRDVDALNPRTKMRAIPAGFLQLKQVNLFFFASCVIFVAAAACINRTTLLLCPIALGLLLFYSHTKRFTPLCHFVLGLSMAVAPCAAWIACTGSFALVPCLLSAAVVCWGAGFDIIYSLQDEEFDREHHLRSLPETIGKAKALAISRVCHVFAVAFIIVAGVSFGADVCFYAGVSLVSGLLIYEQSLVKPNDLSRVNMAFFTLNGFVSIGLFVFALIGQIR